jgi:hypothetical protein
MNLVVAGRRQSPRTRLAREVAEKNDVGATPERTSVRQRLPPAL